MYDARRRTDCMIIVFIANAKLYVNFILMSFIILGASTLFAKNRFIQWKIINKKTVY